MEEASEQKRRERRAHSISAQYSLMRLERKSREGSLSSRLNILSRPNPDSSRVLRADRRGAGRGSVWSTRAVLEWTRGRTMA